MVILDILSVILFVIFVLTISQRLVYYVVRFTGAKRKWTAQKQCRYAVMIAARNEENVIGNLIDSIKKQDYPQELIDIYVVADNCTDSTAEVCRRCGARVFERFDSDHRSKGFALQHLYKQIRAELPGDYYDGFFVFDADNLLDSGYVSAMNEVFSNGKSVVIGYRTAKNFEDNWISASYGIFFLTESECCNRPRDYLGTSCFLSGTGCLFSSSVLEEHGGWVWTGLTEDLECTATLVSEGEKIAYCADAILYDEQPTGFMVSIQQRTRWIKGYLHAMYINRKGLFRRMFKPGWFAAYDLLMDMGPFVSFVVNLVANIVRTSVLVATGATSLLSVLTGILSALVMVYGLLYLMGILTIIAEWKRIPLSAWKKILYSFAYAVFMYTFFISYFLTLFRTPEWKHIPHNVSKTIDEMDLSAK
ncbi:MAG: glycosyltransferase family 2 protein [Clostridia bacterium]|nr:glycosyltransferase family 2 protein [Clostridia bacterium]